MARQIGALTARHGNGDPPRVGILLRNSPAHVGALLGVLAGGGTVVVINPSRGDERTRADISALRLPLVIGTPADIANLVTSSSETTLVAITTWPNLRRSLPRRHRRRDPGRPGVAVWMLTSGTTGPPKRVDLTYNMLARSVIGRDPDQSPAPTRLRTRGRHRQLTAGARRRRVPGAAVHRRGAPVRAAAEVRTPDLGAGRPRAPAAGGIAGARRTANGAALRPDPGGPRQCPRRHVRNRSAVRRRCRRVHREVRHSGTDLLCRNGIRWRGGRLDTGRPSAPLA